MSYFINECKQVRVFNGKISESSDECDSSESRDYQFEKEDMFISTVPSMSSTLQSVLTADW